MRFASGLLARAVLVAVLAALLASGVEPAVAQDDTPTAVVTTIDPCVPLDLPHFRRLLSIELGTSIDYQPEAPREPGRTWVHLSCVPGGIALQLEDGVTRKSMHRVLDAAAIAPAERTRLLALAVAEFVVASWVELRVAPQPSVPAVGAAAASAPAARAARTTVDRRFASGAPSRPAKPVWELAGGVGVDMFTSHPAVLATGSLRLVQSAAPPLAFMLGADVGFVRVPVLRMDDRAGEIDLVRATGIAALLFGGEIGELSAWAGPGIRLGVIHMRALSRLALLSGSSSLELHGGPNVLGRFGYRFTRQVGVALELEVGAVAFPVEVTVEEGGEEYGLLELSDAWVSAALQATVAF